MGTTVEELKRLYTKLGGKDKQVATFNQPGEIINAINELDLPTDYELPKVTTTDVGKVLTVSDEGKWDAEEAGGGLPEVTSADEGKVLTVDSEGAWGAETPTKELPAVTAEDNGKVLGVVDGGWSTTKLSDNYLVLPCTLDGDRLTSPITAEEMVNARKAGKFIVLLGNDVVPANRNIFYVTEVSTISGTTWNFTAIGTLFSSSKLILFRASNVQSSGKPSFEKKTVTITIDQ